MIKRILSSTITKNNNPKKAIILTGPRQTGKTTMLKSMFPEALWLDGDETDDREDLKRATSTFLKNKIGANETLIIDEAQRIENIGITLKLITDKIPNVQLIASGSSAFELANKIKEPLTGRAWEYTLLPLSFEEMTQHHGLQNETRLLEQRMIYGYYPEVVNHPGNEKNMLKLLASNYLYKDILTWENIKKPNKLEKLVQALAMQIGSQVSYHELSKIVGINSETIEKYIELLEKSFVLFRLHSFSRNMRNELVKSKKVFFYDLGLRNAIINQFNPLSLRQDVGGMWENFLIAERMKYRMNHLLHVNSYFWRTKEQSEIDYIEDYEGEIHAYEFKYSATSKVKFPISFVNQYHPKTTQLIHKENFHEFLCDMSSYNHSLSKVKH